MHVCLEHLYSRMPHDSDCLLAYVRVLLSRATRSLCFSLVCRIDCGSTKDIISAESGLWLSNPIVKMPAITTVCLKKRYFDLDWWGCEEDLISVLRLFFFFFSLDLSMLFYISGLKIILQMCSLIPIQKAVFAGTVLGSTGFRVKTPWKMGLKPIGFTDFATDACQAMLCVSMGLTAVIVF